MTEAADAFQMGWLKHTHDLFAIVIASYKRCRRDKMNINKESDRRIVKEQSPRNESWLLRY